MKKISFFLFCSYFAFAKTLTYTEVKQLAQEATSAFLQEYQPKGKPTLIISNITNEADIDIDLLTLSIARDIRQSGKYNLINSKESMLKNARGMRDDEEYNPATVIEKGELIAPNISLSGAVSKQTQDGVTTYLLLLTLTDIKTGLLLWDKDIFLSQELDDSVKIHTVDVVKPLPITPAPQKQETKKTEEQESRNSFFLLGLEGGLGAGVDSSLTYFGGAKIGYAYKGNSFFSFSVYGLYELHNCPTADESEDKKRSKKSRSWDHSVYGLYELHNCPTADESEDKKRSKKSRSWDDEEDDKEKSSNIYQGIGAGARINLSVLYAGANFLYDLNSSNVDYLFDAGFSFSFGIVDLSIGARYTLAPDQSVKNQFSGVIGLDFRI